MVDCRSPISSSHSTGSVCPVRTRRRRMRCNTQARHSRRHLRRCSRTRRCTRLRPFTRRTRSFCSASVSVPTPSSRPCNSSNSNRCLSNCGQRMHPPGPRRRQQLSEQLGRRHRLPVPHPSVRPEAAPHRLFSRRQGNRYHSQPDSRELGSREEARLDRPRPRAEEAATAVVAELVAQGHRHRLDRSVAGSALVARRGRQAHPAHLEAGSAEADSSPALRAGEAQPDWAPWATCPLARRSIISPRTDCVRPRRR